MRSALRSAATWRPPWRAACGGELMGVLPDHADRLGADGKSIRNRSVGRGILDGESAEELEMLDQVEHWAALADASSSGHYAGVQAHAQTCLCGSSPPPPVSCTLGQIRSWAAAALLDFDVSAARWRADAPGRLSRRRVPQVRDLGFGARRAVLPGHPAAPSAPSASWPASRRPALSTSWPRPAVDGAGAQACPGVPHHLARRARTTVIRGRSAVRWESAETTPETPKKPPETTMRRRSRPNRPPENLGRRAPAC